MLIKHIKYYLREFIFDWFPKLMKVVLVLCLAGLTALMFSEVWLRYILHLPLLWVEEVVVIPAFWLYMLGASYGSYDRSHIKVEIIDVLVKSENRRLTSHIITAIVTLALAVLFLFWASSFFIWDLSVDARTKLLQIPMMWARSSIFVGAILMVFYFSVELVDLVGQRFGKPPLFQRGQG